MMASPASSVNAIAVSKRPFVITTSQKEERVRVDASMLKKHANGLQSTARKARAYTEFGKISSDVATILIAHNSKIGEGAVSLSATNGATTIFLSAIGQSRTDTATT